MGKLLTIFFWLFSFIVNFSEAEKVQIKLGVTLPLTGRLSHVGEDTRRGFELALEDFISPDVSIEAVFEDNQHDTKLAASTAHKLLDQDNVDVIVSMWDMADIVAPLADKKKIPHLAIRWDSDVAKKYSTTFTVESTYQSYLDSTVELLKKLNVNSVGIVTEEGKGWVIAGEYLLQKLSFTEVKVVGNERYSPVDLGYRSTILRLLRNKPDMIVLLSNPPHTENLIRRIREVSPNQRFTGYFEILEMPSLVEGLPFVAQFEVAEWFNKKFKERYGTAPISRAPQAYDIIKLLFLAAKQFNLKPTTSEILKTLRAEENLTGASGRLHLGDERSIESECVWKVARDGKFIRYQ